MLGVMTMPRRALLSPILGTLTPSPPSIQGLPSVTLIPSHYPLRSKSLRFSSISHGRNPVTGDNLSPLDEALEAVVEVLQEYGASKEDSAEIASSSPKYIETLLESVWELDEHSLWSSWGFGVREGEKDLGGLGLKRKVYYMAKSKEDGGILPFLESVGLKHSSAMFITRYLLPSERLPELIKKVKFVKGMLFSRCDNKEFVGRNARRMMMHLSIYIDEDIQSTLSFFEKIEAGHSRLNMLGYEDTSFPYLIESFPKLLLCSMESHLQPLVDFIERIGIPNESIGAILLLFPPIIFYDIEKDINPRMRVLQKVGVEDKDLGKMLLKYPWILSPSIQNNYENILAFFNEKKVPKSSVDVAIKSWPHILGCSTSKLKSIVEQFHALGVNKRMLAPVITSSPQLLLKRPSEFLEVVSFMEKAGFDSRAIGKILCRSPEIFASSIEKTLRKKVEFLTDFGISKDRIPRVIKKYPELLLLDIQKTLLPRMRYLMRIGLSKSEVCSMVTRFSPLLGYSIEAVFRPKLAFLLRTMRKPLKDIVEYPRYFSYSLDKRIKPRFWVLKGRNLDCSLKDMLAKNDEEFAEEFMGIERALVIPSPSPSNDGR